MISPAGTSLQDVEREAILRTLELCGGNRTHASQQLGISIRTLRNRLREYRNEGIMVPQAGSGMVREKEPNKLTLAFGEEVNPCLSS